MQLVDQAVNFGIEYKNPIKSNQKLDFPILFNKHNITKKSMKNVILLLLLTTIVGYYPSFAQKEKPANSKRQIGITYSSFGSNDVFRKEELEGGAGYYGDRFYNLGISYLYPLNRTFDFEMGIVYSYK